MNFPHLAARLFDTPLLIDPGKLSTLIAALGPRIDPGHDWGMIDPAHAREVSRSDTGYTVADGVAVIPVEGTLVHRGSTPNAMSGLTGYNRLSEWYRAALDDPAVKAILLDIDSPGGEVAGAFDFSDEIFASRGQKPVVAVAADLAASAGFLIACAADEVVITRTGRVGSVGVVTAHADLSRAAEKQGVVLTHIYAGAHKVDGHPYGPLPDDVRARVQGEVDRLYGLFTETVARNRGLTDADVRATEALMYMGPAAVDVGFADRVSTREATFAALSRSASSSRSSTRLFMSAQSTQTTETRMEHPETNTQAASPDTATLAAHAAEARTNERTRIRAILQSEAATGRQDMAAHLAFETDMAADSAVALLGKAPAMTARPHGALAAAMAKTEQPKIGADASTDAAGGAETGSSQASAAAILADFNKATGRAPGRK